MPGMSGRIDEQGRGGGALWWAALQQVEGVGAATMLRLARAFGSAEAALAASSEELMARGGLSREQAAGMAASAGALPALRSEIEGLEREGIRLLVIGEPGYPPELLDLRSPPPLLYVRGRLREEDRRAVAVVGTREASREGARLARKLGRGLAERGFTIVSGLARGIDTAGHRGALQAREGRTVAVLGCGVQRVYPPENGLLAAKIARRGCVLAEAPPQAEVHRRYLLARDRVQAALSRALIVVQAHGRCGSLVTARHAVRCGRLLLGVAWEQEPFAEGWERLQALGARRLEASTSLDEIAAEIERGPDPPSQVGLL